MALGGGSGPNGAGKTTTIRILATLTRPSGGTARVLGHDVRTQANAIRARVAVTGQFASLDEDLTGYENLLILGRLHGLSRSACRRRADDLLAAFDLTGAAGRPVGGYSGGMRRRLDIGAGLIVTPDLLFLDEPTTGLDPRSRNQVWELVRRVAAAGTTVLLTTQYLEEADRLAERIAVVDHGRIVAEGTSTELKSRVGSGTLQLRLLDGEQRPQALRILAPAVRDPAVVLGIANAVLMPLSFAGNVFVRPSTMPGRLQAFVEINPLSHVASAARALMGGTGGTGEILWSLAATATLTLICGPITLHLYGRRD
ncbi:ATP-binding cassette domain-containing protein [Embleya sp. NPDC005971]|uniref:ATP-binding cassette domain-containing protein n=1 Tax=Embleya sp. NPDC005971 TaxID=3156724 RepID=UPI0033DFEA61